MTEEVGVKKESAHASFAVIHKRNNAKTTAIRRTVRKPFGKGWDLRGDAGPGTGRRPAVKNGHDPVTSPRCREKTGRTSCLKEVQEPRSSIVRTPTFLCFGLSFPAEPLSCRGFA